MAAIVGFAAQRRRVQKTSVEGLGILRAYGGEFGGFR